MLIKFGACPSEAGLAGNTPQQVKESLDGALIVLTFAFTGPLVEAFGGLGALAEAGTAADAGGDAANTVFRADGRGPEEIFTKGFEPKGDNMDLFEHASSNPSDSGYVSTSSRLGFAQDWAAENGYDYIYKLRATGLDVNAELGADSPFPWENEIAVPRAIPGSDIEGVWGPGGWTDNPGFAP
jgi:hypothetical protein